MSEQNAVANHDASLYEPVSSNELYVSEEESEDDDTPFFRPEAVNKQRQTLNHRVTIAQPATLVATSWLLGLSLLAGLFFLSSADMVEKHTVSGYLKTDQPVNTVQITTAGTVSHLMVKNGQRVKQGEALFTVQPFSPIVADERTATAQLTLLEQELSTLLTKSELLKQQLEQQRYDAQLLHAEQLDTLTRLNQSLLLTQEKATIAQAQHLKSQRLADKQLVAIDVAEQAKLQLIGAEEDVMRLTREIAQTQHAIQKNQHQLTMLETQHDLTQADLTQAVTQKRSEILSLRAQEQMTYYANIDGVVNGLDLAVGSEIRETSAIFSIVPEQATLQGVLMIPVAQARLLAVGQPVVLRYHSYPHQTFGRYHATIAHIDDYLQQPNADSSPMIRVDITLEQQHVGTNKPLPLLTGMTFDADVHYEEKTLLAWLLGPLTDFKGRIL